MKILLVAAVAVTAFLAFNAKADAMVESCPARLIDLQPTAKSPSGTLFTYSLGALSKRTVDAAILADTDRGWYAWSVEKVDLGSVTRTDTAGTFPVHYTAWASPELHVAIPGDVTVKHAWVIAGLATGDTEFTWNGKGVVTCDVPGFDAPPAVPPPAPVLATVASLPPDTALAKTVAPPSDLGTCTTPFVAARVVRGVTVDTSKLGGLTDGLADEAAVVDVVVDGTGKILDAWIEGSTHSAFDQLVLGAAIHSAYSGAISYCHPVEGIVKYTATFQPPQ